MNEHVSEENIKKYLAEINKAIKSGEDSDRIIVNVTSSHCELTMCNRDTLILEAMDFMRRSRNPIILIEVEPDKEKLDSLPELNDDIKKEEI